MMIQGQDGRTTRRAFLGGCAGFGGLAALGGCAGLRADRCAPSAPPNYWCTWATQARLVDANVKSGVLAVPGDQGLPGVRDNLTEAVLFGKDGWAHTQYPSVRGNLYLVLDDGWDVPFGCAPGKDIGAFASCVLDARRFPSFTGTPAARLRALDARIRACGWRGTGLWIACQAFGENGRNKFPEERLREELKRKLAASAEAGVAYWKVDWGVRGGEIAYRRMMSELRAAYAPGLQIEHCCPPDVPLNGVSFGKGTSVSGTGRLLGDPAFETRLRARVHQRGGQRLHRRVPRAHGGRDALALLAEARRGGSRLPARPRGGGDAGGGVAAHGAGLHGAERAQDVDIQGRADGPLAVRARLHVVDAGLRAHD